MFISIKYTFFVLQTNVFNMEDLDFFSQVDTMLSETLTVKSIEEMCKEITDELEENRGKCIDNYKFSSIIGGKGERIVRKFLENLGYVFLSQCKDISHDYIFLKNGKEQTFEIKTDSAHMRENKEKKEFFDSGNMAIEYECRGKNSGIAATKADFFVTYYPHLNEIWLIKTEKLKSIIRENKSTIKRIENVGDEGINTKLFLLKRDDFKEHFRIANPYNKV